VAGTGGTPGFTLVSYLTAPLLLNSRQDYVLFCHEEADQFVWLFENPDTHLYAKKDSGDTVSWHTPAGATLRTTVVILRNGVDIATLSLSQSVIDAPAAWKTFETGLEANGASANHLFNLREVCVELKPYIDAAAAATEPNGVPARLLAAILFREHNRRYRDGSPGADVVRNELQGQEFNPRLDAIQEKLERAMGNRVVRTRLTYIREEEISLVRSFFNELETRPVWDPKWLTLFFAGKTTIGVGQVAQTTAAMALGKTTWRDLPTGAARSATLEEIENDYLALGKGPLVDIFNELRFPKTNIDVAAKLLAKIKNRPTRYPAMTARDLLSDGTAIGVIATEYNAGASTRTANAVTISDYGTDVQDLTLAATDLFGLTNYFPDPP